MRSTVPVGGGRSPLSFGEKIVSASDRFSSAKDFAARLRALRGKRREQKLALRDQVVRKSLSRSERQDIFEKTAGRCHICGGIIEGDWEADHVFSHSLGGQHEADNYLPAHPICNNYRWFYGTEEFQWILKLGVWLRTQIEKETALGRLAAKAFCTYDSIRAGRRTKNTEPNAAPNGGPAASVDNFKAPGGPPSVS